MSKLRVWFEMIFGGRSGNLLLALTISLVILAIFRPSYFTVDNIRVIALNVSSIGIASVGMALLIVSGSVDLSIGAIYAAAAVMSAWLALTVSPPLAIIGGLLLGGLLGLANGALVWRIRVSPIIVTLGTFTIIRGLMIVLTHGRSIYGIPEEFFIVGRAVPFGIPTQVLTLVLVAILAHIVLSRTTIGRHIYAIGTNREASSVAGINVRLFVLLLFVANGVFAALPGILAASRFGAASIEYGVGFELQVITAVILGGVAFSGGEGSIKGVMLAVAFLGVMNSGLISLGVDPAYTDVVRGAALVASVLIEQLTQERNERFRRTMAMEDWASQMREKRADGTLRTLLTRK
jgi:ribose/xylose/arabinose/galactoside ABC-type transport system permease subunit